MPIGTKFFIVILGLLMLGFTLNYKILNLKAREGIMIMGHS